MRSFRRTTCCEHDGVLEGINVYNLYNLVPLCNDIIPHNEEENRVFFKIPAGAVKVC